MRVCIPMSIRLHFDAIISPGNKYKATSIFKIFSSAFSSVTSSAIA